MNREERRIFNQMKKLDPAGMICVEIPTNYSQEARQAIHDALMFRGMVATRVNWLKDDVYALHYIPTAGHAEREAARQKQEGRDIDEITAALPHSDFTWNGYQNPATVTKEEETETEDERRNEPMKRTNTTPAAQTASKPAKKSPFDTVREKQNRAETLLQDPENPTNRAELVRMVSNAVAFHDSGKIEGLFSLDVACSNSKFCPRMQQCGNPAIICSHCYTKKMFALPRMAHHVTGTILSEILFTVDELRFVTVPGIYLRIDSDGELINLTHARNVIRLAKAHPETAAVTPWTKRPEILDEAIALEGKPENLICGISSVFINRHADAARYLWADFIFTVYTPAGMIEALKRGEHECNGKKCQHCGFFCYKRHDTTRGPVYVAEALRPAAGVKPDRFAAICAEIDARTLDA